MQQVDVNRSQECRKCIECYLWQNTCHVIRDHPENERPFAGARLLMRVAELEIHPADEADRREIAQDDFGLATATSPSVAQTGEQHVVTLAEVVDAGIPNLAHACHASRGNSPAASRVISSRLSSRRAK